MTDKQTNELNSGIHFFVKIVFSTFALIISGLNAFYLLIADAIPGEVQFSAAEQVWLWIFLAVPLGFIWISWAGNKQGSSICLYQ
jgi:apolipoprotein N-acyltransferase